MTNDTLQNAYMAEDFNQNHDTFELTQLAGLETPSSEALHLPPEFFNYFSIETE